MGISIVVVDDSEPDRYLAKRVIGMLDYDVDVVEYPAGDRFLEKLVDRHARSKEIGSPPPPTLVLLDINMPRVDGFEVLEAIQQHFGKDSSSELVVSMYTSSNFADDKDRAAKFDFVKEYVVKPLSKDDAKRLVESYCLNTA
ncbi:response regulator [Stieleria sp. JC731]|uniref:response regulator n=1 Tax=Pirellulaceae TaxID=2691357 RepID=UPI001E2DF83B|nr:response regulator [Stieleria sp. JC731]MCC9601681.1 response regulator [Stieleria sp. JC731]